MNYIVYMHTNKINGKKYIGITCQSPKRRWRDGDGYLENRQQVFYRAIQKYGWENFTHEILDENLLFEQAIEKEKAYIKLYHTYIHDDPCYGYNMTRGGEGFVHLNYDLIRDLWDQGWNITTIAKEINASRSGVARALENYENYSSEESKKRSGQLAKTNLSCSILQYDLNGNFVAKYNSFSDAARTLNKCEGNISRACDCPVRTAYGFIWRTENSSIPPVPPPKKGTKRVDQLDYNFNYIKTFNSMTEAAEEIKKHPSSISHACSDPSRTCGGFRWRYSYGG